MLTYDQVAAQLGISVRQVYNLVNGGKLVAHKYGDQRNSPVRFRQGDVSDYIESTRAPRVSNDDTTGSMDESDREGDR